MEVALEQLQLLPWRDQGVKAVAAAGGDDDHAGSEEAAAKTGKKRRLAAQGVKLLLSAVVEMVGKRLECSVPASKFGHVAYIR
ncbi:hypothetical protein HU200_051912 [Digitaria exilis]|uniref:Uncharacterized protein n=1 Tax=Digitaria exilis TaxID=1010633 RepID=A0A835AZK2_9POAL|nr:hypothetical protein HU200_051912 [Digitaria exilis]